MLRLVAKTVILCLVVFVGLSGVACAQGYYGQQYQTPGYGQQYGGQGYAPVSPGYGQGYAPTTPGYGAYGGYSGYGDYVQSMQNPGYAMPGQGMTQMQQGYPSGAHGGYAQPGGTPNYYYDPSGAMPAASQRTEPGYLVEREIYWDPYGGSYDMEEFREQAPAPRRRAVRRNPQSSGQGPRIRTSRPKRETKKRSARTDDEPPSSSQAMRWGKKESKSETSRGLKWGKGNDKADSRRTLQWGKEESKPAMIGAKPGDRQANEQPAGQVSAEQDEQLQIETKKPTQRFQWGKN